VSAFLLINLTNAARGASGVPAERVPIAASQLHDAIPTLVVGFVGGFVHADDVRHSEVQLARTLQGKYGDQVKVEIFKNRDAVQAHEAIVEWWNSLGGNMLPQSSTPAAGIILFGHSWGASTVVYDFSQRIVVCLTPAHYPRRMFAAGPGFRAVWTLTGHRRAADATGILSA
jgi:hypothetical protein